MRVLRVACALLLTTSLAACAGPIAEIRTDLAEQALRRQAARQDDATLRAFYADHPKPLWIAEGRLRPEAHLLIPLAGRDAAQLATTFARADNGDPIALGAAELAASAALAKVALEARASSAPIVFADPALAPPRNRLDALRAAARARSLGDHLRSLAIPNPLFAELAAASAASDLPADQDARVKANLDRLKALPNDLGGRFVLVDIPAARLWLYEAGRPVHEMRVVVGASSDPTPLMAASLRYAVVNPYWNLPPDLASERIAPQVLQSGPRALQALNMEVLTGWRADATIKSPELVDWAAVAKGAVVRVRQRPGPHNTLGRAKFVMPNNLGIYLHDTPERERLASQSAYRSAGCVRLADADHLGRWLLGEDWKPTEQAENRLPLDAPVPVYIVYRTASVEGGKIRFLPDPYHLDPPAGSDSRATVAGARIPSATPRT